MEMMNLKKKVLTPKKEKSEMKALSFGIAICVCAALSSSLAGDEKAQSVKEDALKRQQEYEKELAAEGGIVVEPYSGRYVVIVNNQTRIDEKDFFEPDRGIEDLFNYPVLVVKPGADLKKAGLVITISDNKTAPSLLVAPETPWAGVNVFALATDDPDKKVLVSRLQKEIWRAFLFVCGAANSNMQPCIMRPIFRAKDLDEFPVSQPCPDPIGKVMQMANRLGIAEKNMTTYRDACTQGWAPAPTNDVQRKIWEQIKKPESRWQKDFGGKDGKSK